DVENVSGNITLSNSRAGAIEHAHLQTVSGGIDATGADGRVKLETVSGKISFAAPTVIELGAESVSGAINAATSPAKSGRIHAQTMSGSVHLQLPANLAARVHAE